MPQQIDATDAQLSLLTGELRNPALERAFRTDLAASMHRVWSHLAMVIAATVVTFSAVDLGSLGFGATWVALLGARLVAAGAVVLTGLRVGRDPGFVDRRRGRTVLVAAQLLTAAAALSAIAARPADAMTSVLSLVVLVTACTVMVPGRFRNQMAVGSLATGGLVAVAVTRFDASTLPILPLVANLCGALLLGGTIRMLMNRDQRQRWLAGQRLAEQLDEATALRGELERLAREDSLTGAVNRREFMARLRRLTEDRRGSVALVMLDLDRFKSINDRLGHQAGDAVLVAVVAALAGVVRGDDVVARLGGEEFAVALTGTDPGTAQDTAERLRRAVEEHAPPGLEGLVTASFGVATHHAGESEEALMARADAAMYRAKRGGGNAVVVAPPPPGREGTARPAHRPARA